MNDDIFGPNSTLIGQPGSRSLLETPALVLDVERLDANIRSMSEHAVANGYQIRACGKIHKSVEIARRQVNAGAVGVCCATLSEAESFVAGGIPGVMLFTSVVTDHKLNRLAALNARAENLLVVADDSENIKRLGHAVRPTGKVLKVMVDFELGGERTGVPDFTSALSLARLINGTEGLDFAGIQAYNGRGLAQADFESRKKILLDRLGRLSELVVILDAEGLHPAIVSGGGTGSHDIDHLAGIYTEMQVGSYVFMDLYYKDTVMRKDSPHPFKNALTVRGTIVGAAQRGFAIANVGIKEIDGAYTQIAPLIAYGAPIGASYSIAGDDLGRITFGESTDRLEVGASVELIPPHCYQTVALHSAFHCVVGDTLVDIWPISALTNW